MIMYIVWLFLVFHPIFSWNYIKCSLSLFRASVFAYLIPVTSWGLISVSNPSSTPSLDVFSLAASCFSHHYSKFLFLSLYNDVSQHWSLLNTSTEHILSCSSILYASHRAEGRKRGRKGGKKAGWAVVIFQEFGLGHVALDIFTRVPPLILSSFSLILASKTPRRLLGKVRRVSFSWCLGELACWET